MQVSITHTRSYLMMWYILPGGHYTYTCYNACNLLHEMHMTTFIWSIHKFSGNSPTGKFPGKFRKMSGNFPTGKIPGKIPGNSGKFRETFRRENFRGNFRGKFRENLFSRQPNLSKSQKSGKHAL